MATARTPRRTWIDQGLRALAVGGPDAVRVEALAKDLGVTKGGFYGYFDNRRALLTEILDAWERMTLHEVIDFVEAEGGDARFRLRRLLQVATTGPELLEIDLAVRDWSRRDKSIAKRLKRVDNARMEYMRSLFSVFCRDEDEVEVRCMIVYSLWIGNHFIAADHGARSSDQVLEMALERLLV